MRILFFGDGPWAQKSLEYLINLSGVTICGVVLRYDNPDFLLKKIAEKNSISVYIEKNVNCNNFLNFCKNLAFDLGVSMSFNQIIKSKLREIPQNGFINCHAGKLPNYRGRNIINWALINDEKEIGVTAHYIDDSIDTGAIITQSSITISESDNYRTLLFKATDKCAEVLIRAVQKIKDGNVAAKKQSHINGSYFSYRREGDELIDWNWSSRRIHNFIRALVAPAPGAQTFLRQKKIYIWKSEETDFPNYLSTPGEVIRKDKDGIIVKTGDNAIKINLISYGEEEDKVVPGISVGQRLGINLYQKIIELENSIRQLTKNNG
ncbi:methionyl-tRNA formyltransferase [Sporolactobacillus sp. CQH2019]|uniref:methionyl-tRNA formyltransferase n=1 Tax=Sporolactobacillus sp. CQH2019 TaxID=3023512 RepID=UPI002368F146|nr:methionyl-tRNA formyltransferase [Sporolactobacillus sp. CQH2019]MDD9148065.1 methionyl-tRNA formyltransferase [Sporolactobacillus sp. CQH2019]